MCLPVAIVLVPGDIQLSKISLSTSARCACLHYSSHRLFDVHWVQFLRQILATVDDLFDIHSTKEMPIEKISSSQSNNSKRFNYKLEFVSQRLYIWQNFEWHL
jgi:hypothetical protein